MKTTNVLRNSISLSLIAAVAAIASATEHPSAAAKGAKPAEHPGGVPTRMEEMLVSKRATVKAVNYETRQLILVDELGKEVTFNVSDKVQRLQEVAVGDIVEADYYIGVAAELREPTAEERANPLQIEEGGARAPTGMAPAGVIARVVKAVCTIEGLDRPTGTITLLGPRGGLNVVKAADVANLPKLRIGQSVVVTFTEAFVTSLEKVAK
jgi:hypothetical protein